MKKYLCDRCGKNLITPEGVEVHYNMKDRQWKHLSKKHEHLVCELCVLKRQGVKEKQWNL